MRVFIVSTVCALICWATASIDPQKAKSQLLDFASNAIAASPGCAGLGCDGRQSYNIPPATLPNTSSVTVRWMLNASDASVRADSNLSAFLTQLPGCVGNGASLVCPFPIWTAPYVWGGLIMINGASGAPTSFWSGTGSAHCAASAQASWLSPTVATQLPVVDMIGNVWTWDVGTIAALAADGAVSWQKGLFPAPAGGCPEVLTQVAATDYGTLAFGVGSLAEGFTCFPNGIPEAAFIFSGNSSDGRRGSFTPAGPLAISGNRILYPTRFVAAESDEAAEGSSTNGGAASSAAAASRTVENAAAAGASAAATPPQWYLAALDQNTQGVSRMTWAWTAALPTGPVPSNGLGCSSPQMAGPLIVRVAQDGVAGAFADVAVIAFSCNGSATLSAVLVNATSTAAAPEAARRSLRQPKPAATAAVHDDDAAADVAAQPRTANSSGSTGFGGDPNILSCPSVWSPDAAPCLLWTRNVTLAGTGDAVLALAADRVNAAAADAGAEDIWLSTAGVPGSASSQLMRFDGLSGALVTSVNLGDALLLSGSGSGASVATATASPGWLLLSGFTLAVAFRTDTANASAGTTEGERQQPWRGLAAESAAGANIMMAKALAATCGDSRDWEGIAAAAQSGGELAGSLYGIAAFTIGGNASVGSAATAAAHADVNSSSNSESAGSGSSDAAGLLWCTLTPSLGAGNGAPPGTYAVVGQPAALAPGVLPASSGGALVIVTTEGAIAALG